MKILSTWTSFLLATLLAGCTSESEQNIDNPTGGGGTDNDDNRREVTLILKNDLVLRTGQTTKAPGQALQAGGVTTKADTPIATTDENAISSLDVYVFGSETENGEYTFQEKFVYRDNAEGAGSLPPSASQLKLSAVAGDTKETTGLLKLKKGLFVKLYCIANNTKLIGTDGNEVAEAAFVPIVFTEAGNAIQTEGQPKENVFTSYHTPLLSATEPTDVLTTPLAMSGAYITPLDLTDFESSARMQVSFKLTRIAARFDIINNAETSKFTIESIAMGKARRGATFFPIRIYGDTPTAKDGELITCPARTFEGDNANLGMQTGAFYSYPSPKEDQGYLILKGTYQVNLTESKEVTYQVPFKNSSDDGNTSYLEINNNHRYTLAITDADDYHLDFTLNVDDWADDGSIDQYTPGTETGNIAVNVPAGDTETQYDEDNHTVIMSLNPGTNFTMFIEKTSAILPTMTKTYAGGLEAQEYDWLDITAPISTAAAVTKADADASGYKYSFALKSGYTGSRYPRAIVRFTNLTNGAETVLFVDARDVPRPMTTVQEAMHEHNSFDPQTGTAKIYRLNDSKLYIKVFCSAGAKIDQCPDWLTPLLLSQNTGENLFVFTLNDVNATPTDDEGKIVFKNTKADDKTMEVTVKLLAADITPDFSKLDGSKNILTPATAEKPANILMKIAENNTFKITSIDDIQVLMNFNGGTQWLRNDYKNLTKAATNDKEIDFTIDNDKLLGAKPVTITLKTMIVGGKDYVFTVTPDFTAPSLTSNASMTFEGGKENAAIEITGTNFGGCTIVNEQAPEWLTYNEKTTNNNTFHFIISMEYDNPGFPTSVPDEQNITLVSNINPDKKTNVTLSFTDGWVEEEINQDEVYTNPDGSKTEYRVKTTGKKLTLNVYTVFTKPTIETIYDPDYGSNQMWLPVPAEPNTSNVGHRKKFTYDIVVPPTHGTDPDYQLHKATLTIKHPTATIKELTIWRGASNVPYRIGRADNPYYSGILKNGFWWAPVNVGASQIAINSTDVSSIGKFYQWGRNVPTTYGSTVGVPGPVTADTNDEFIISESNWLTPSNDYLWRDANGKKTTKDPCPDGWRVPLYDEQNFSWTTGTWDSGTSIFSTDGDNDGLKLVLPGCGYRYFDGKSFSQGREGYYWSTTTNSYGYGLIQAIDKDAKGYGRSQYKGSALSVRCVQE